MNKKYVILSLAVLMIVVFGFFSSISKNIDAYAQSSQVNLSGWGWSSNIGWVDFSKSTFSTTTTTGTLAGYAWSSNIGWISFNPAKNSDCPLQAEDGGDCTPRVNLTTGKVQGWARALAGCQNDVWSGSACIASSSGNANGIVAVTPGTYQNSGWDGWIHLSGVNHTSPNSSGNGGVTFNTTTGSFTGYAWGGDVVGWLTFDPHVPGVDPVNCTTGCCGSNCGGSDLIGSCIADPTHLPIGGGSVDFTITPSNGTGPYSAVSWASSGNTLRKTFGSVTASMGAFDVPITDSATGSGTITCPAVGVDTEAPTAKMWVNNNTALTLTKIRTGRSAKINWSVADYINDGYDYCVGTGSTLSNWTGISITTDKPSGTPYLLPIVNQGTYTLKIKCSLPDDPLDYRETNAIQVIVSDSTIEEI
jgi:hypothetical protein